jgi:hypothetical protein
VIYNTSHLQNSKNIFQITTIDSSERIDTLEASIYNMVELSKEMSNCKPPTKYMLFLLKNNGTNFACLIFHKFLKLVTHLIFHIYDTHTHERERERGVNKW